jgi:hypothetical protein
VLAGVLAAFLVVVCAWGVNVESHAEELLDLNTFPQVPVALASVYSGTNLFIIIYFCTLGNLLVCVTLPLKLLLTLILQILTVSATNDNNMPIRRTVTALNYCKLTAMRLPNCKLYSNAGR